MLLTLLFFDLFAAFSCFDLIGVLGVWFDGCVCVIGYVWVVTFGLFVCLVMCLFGMSGFD